MVVGRVSNQPPLFRAVRPVCHPSAIRDGQQAVLYRSKMNPFLGRNFEALDPLEWLARMSDHIPDPGQHWTLFYGEYANRVRGAQQAEPEPATTPADPPKRRCCASWARLIAKVYQVDPLLCTCGGERH